MKKRQIFSVFLLIGMLLVMIPLSACTQAQESIKVRVKITGLDNDLLCDREVEVKGNNPTVKSALEQACEDTKLTLEYSTDGNAVKQIGDYEDLSYSDATEPETEESAEGEEGESTEDENTDETEAPADEKDRMNYYWGYLLNGTEATNFVSQEIVEGDNIEWTWLYYEPTGN